MIFIHSRHYKFNENKMKSNLKTKTISLIALGIIFTLFPIITVNLNFNTGNSNKSLDFNEDSNFDYENLDLSAVSERIHIINNSGWVDFKNAGNCTGNGNYSDPYVIEDLVIDGGGLGDCIYIENSNIYFRIENCTIYNSGFNWAGIKLKSVSNGTLFNNTASNNNQHGILLDGSNLNNLTENQANNNFDNGINLQDSDYNNISGNILVNNSITGINLVYSRYNDITGNEVQRNTEFGMNLTSSGRNNISENNIINNGVGIYLDDSGYNIITGNTINYNIGGGILLSDSTISFWDSTNSNYNTVSGNTINNNGGSGIYFSNSYWHKGSSNTISGNTINNNRGNGIHLSECDYNFVSGNVINNNNGNGIELRYSDHSGISGNSIDNNSGSGIYLSLCKYTSVSGNIVSNSSNVGIRVMSNDYYDDWMSSYSYNTITGNMVKNSYIGIYIFDNYYSDVAGNTVNNSNIGIKIVDGKHNDITGNEVHHNTEYGIYLEKSDWNTIQTNAITNSPVGIYLLYSYNNEISSNTFSGNGVDIKDAVIDLIIWIAIIIVISIAIIVIAIIIMKKRKKSKPNKLRLPKDEGVRYEITQELERQGISVSDHEKYNEIEWRYCKTCKKIVEPNPTKNLLKGQRKLAKKNPSKKQNFLIIAGNQACPHCSNRLIPKELRRFRYYCIFAFCFWVILASIIFPAFSRVNLPASFAELVAGISFTGLLIGFGIYSKFILIPRLKKKMQLAEF